MKSGFDYEKAFSRNIGWVTDSGQQTLRGKVVAAQRLAEFEGKWGEAYPTIGQSWRRNWPRNRLTPLNHLAIVVATHRLGID